MTDTERIPGSVFNVEPFRIGRGWWIRASVDIAGLVVIHNVIASPQGVSWPSTHGEQAITLTNPDLLQRAEAALIKNARETAVRMRSDGAGGQAQ